LNAADPAGSASVERRFTALLDCHADELPGHLRHAVSLLKSKGVPVDWRVLLADVQWWGHGDRFVQREWAREFWGRGSAGYSDAEQDQPRVAAQSDY
jgi:CRISPR system Cascade subunit CasB